MTKVIITGQPEAAVLADRLEITQLASNLLLLVDARDWGAARELLADSVFVDCTSLNGDRPQIMAAADLVAGWQKALSNLEATQHLAGNHVVAVGAAQAACTASVQATHVLSDAAGGLTWTVAGRYGFRLTRGRDGWRFSALTEQSTMGNQHIMLPASAGPRPRGPGSLTMGREKGAAHGAQCGRPGGCHGRYGTDRPAGGHGADRTDGHAG